MQIDRWSIRLWEKLVGYYAGSMFGVVLKLELTKIPSILTNTMGIQLVLPRVTPSRPHILNVPVMNGIFDEKNAATEQHVSDMVHSRYPLQLDSYCAVSKRRGGKCN